MSFFIWRRRAGVALFIFLASFAVANGQSSLDPLTLAEAQRLAVVRSEKLAASAFTRSAAQELERTAGQLPDPVLRFGVESVPATGADRFAFDTDMMTMSRVGVMQEFTRGAKRRWRTERALLTTRVAEAEHDNVRAIVQRETAMAWFEAYFAQREFDLLSEQASLAREAVIAAETTYAQARNTSADVLMTRGMAGMAEDARIEAGNRLRVARIALGRWIDAAAMRPLARSDLDAAPLHAHREQLEAQLRGHPDIVALDRRVELARAEAELARAERKSDWSLELTYGRREIFDDMVSLNVSIPLQVNRGGRQNRELASRLAAVQASQAELDEKVREHRAEIHALLDDFDTARERLNRFQKDLLPLASDRLLAAEAAYRGGKMQLDGLIAARRERIDVLLQALRIEAEMARTWAELSFLGASPVNVGDAP